MEAINLPIDYHMTKISAVRYLNRFYSNSHIEDFKQVFQKLEASVGICKRLTGLGSGIYVGISDVYPVYLIAISGRENMPYHWSDMLPVYENELEEIRDIYYMAVKESMPSSIRRMEEH